MNPQSIERTLRESRLEDRVDDAMHQAIMRTVTREVRDERPRRFRWGLAVAGAGLAVVLVAVVLQPEPARQPAANQLEPLARWLSRPLPVAPLEAVNPDPLEAEWVALNADLSRIRAQIGLRRDRAETAADI